MTPVKLNQENLGRALAEMKLEDRVINNGVLESLKVMERSSLVKGVIDVLVEQGRVSKAIELVYGQSPARGVFDGWDEFKTQIKQKMKGWTKGVTDEACEALLKHWEPEELGEIMENLLVNPHGNERDYRLAEQVHKKMTPEHWAQYHVREGERELAQGKFLDAYQSFDYGGDEARKTQLYNTLLGDAGKHWQLLLTIEDKFLHSTHEAEQILKRALTSDEIANPVAFYDWVKSSPFATPEQKKRFRHLAAKENGKHYDDPELMVPWAQKNWKQHPRKAYEIFVEHAPKDECVLKSAALALNAEYSAHNWDALQRNGRNHHEGLRFEEVKPEHLKTIVDKLTTEVKIEYYEEQGNAKKLREFSKLFYKAGLDALNNSKLHDFNREQESTRAFNRAYDLWVTGAGALDDTFIKGVRGHLIEKAVKSEYNRIPDFDWNDTRGQQEFFDAIKGQERRAYRFAIEHGHLAMVNQARLAYVNKHPAEALNDCADRNDLLGMKLAQDALAKKYGLKSDDLTQYMPKPKSE